MSIVPLQVAEAAVDGSRSRSPARKPHPAQEPAGVRALTESDLPAVARLLARVYPQHGWPSAQACEHYLRSMLFDNPWRALDLPSWVAVRGNDIGGLFAVMPRPMRLADRPIRVAVGCQFVVDPQIGNSYTALKLIKACLSGPQDLTVADGATERVLKLWMGLGGVVPGLCNLHWTRPLRPAWYFWSTLRRNAAASPLERFAVRSLCAGLDGLAAHLRPNRFLQAQPSTIETDLSCATMLEHLPGVCANRALRPVYDAHSLSWLLHQVANKGSLGQLRCRAVYGPDAVLGWYLYFMRPCGVYEVAQLAARPGCVDEVLQRLLADAWRHGACAVRGRFDATQAMELSRRNCWLRTEGPWTVFHTRDPDIAAALQRGDAFFSRLEGEWWVGFQGP